VELEYGGEATRRLHQDGISYGKGFDKQAIMRLNRLKAAVDQPDLSALKGNRFEKLKGDRAGTWAPPCVITAGREGAIGPPLWDLRFGSASWGHG
jgi:hypothetical protein